MVQLCVYSSFTFLQEQLKTEPSADSALHLLDAKESFDTDFRGDMLEVYHMRRKKKSKLGFLRKSKEYSIHNPDP